MNTLKSGFTSYSIIGWPSNFRLPNEKLAINKCHCKIQESDCFAFQQSGLMPVLFRVNDRTPIFKFEMLWHILGKIEIISLFIITKIPNLN